MGPWDVFKQMQNKKLFWAKTFKQNEYKIKVLEESLKDSEDVLILLVETKEDWTPKRNIILPS